MGAIHQSHLYKRNTGSLSHQHAQSETCALHVQTGPLGLSDTARQGQCLAAPRKIASLIWVLSRHVRAQCLLEEKFAVRKKPAGPQDFLHSLKPLCVFLAGGLLPTMPLPSPSKFPEKRPLVLFLGPKYQIALTSFASFWQPGIRAYVHICGVCMLCTTHVHIHALMCVCVCVVVLGTAE